MISAFDLPSLRRALLRYRPPGASHDATAEGPPRAAVALVLREAPSGSELLFIRRADREGDPWSGHVAFPGGRHQQEDGSLLDTAVRETREEVGLDLTNGAELLTALPPTPARASGRRLPLTVAPFVFALTAPAPPLVTDPREVSDALWMPIQPLARGEGRRVHVVEHEGTRYELPALSVGPHVLWGLTYGMWTTLLAAFGDGA